MKTFIAAILTALALSAGAGYCADSPKETGKARHAKQTQKTPKPAKLWADTKKYLAEKGAKTAQIIKINAAKLRQTVSSEPPLTAAKKAELKKAAEAGKGQPAKSE